MSTQSGEEVLKKYQLLQLAGHHLGNDLSFTIDCDDGNSSYLVCLSWAGARELQNYLHAILGPLPVAKKKEDSEKKPQPSVIDLLQEAIKTHNSRHKDYKAGHVVHGRLLKALFPEGVRFDDEDDAARFVLFNYLLGKITRYGILFGEGGHADSVHDAGVYSFILEAFDKGGMR